LRFERKGCLGGRRLGRSQGGNRAGRGACGVNVLGGSVFFPNQHCGYFLCLLIIRALDAKPKRYRQQGRLDVAPSHRVRDECITRDRVERSIDALVSIH
jgi:hypothetical protein